MDPIHRKVLANKTKEIVETLSNPVDMANVSLKTLFSESDRQAINRENDRHGTLRASQLLVSTLEKTEMKAFSKFVDALRSETHKQGDLADELEREVERLGDLRSGTFSRARALDNRMECGQNGRIPSMPLITSDTCAGHRV